MPLPFRPGLDLLEAGRHGAAAEVLGAAAGVSLERLRLVLEAGGIVGPAEVAPVVKKCKAHVAALAGLVDHSGVMATAARYFVQLHSVRACTRMRMCVGGQVQGKGTGFGAPGGGIVIRHNSTTAG